jgi:hypothetical protein
VKVLKAAAYNSTSAAPGLAPDSEPRSASRHRIAIPSRFGPRAAVDGSPLPLGRLPKAGGARLVAFCQRFIVMPKGTGARKHMVVRSWQRDRIGEVFDPDPRPRFALWSMPRGQGKSAMASAIGLYALHADGTDDASVVVVAADERQAGIVFNTAVRMTELSKPLLERTQVFRDPSTSPDRARPSRCCPPKPTGSKVSTPPWRSSTKSVW